MVYSDSDWAGDKDNRRSVSGFIMFLCGVPIVWRSKQQKSVALSSSEAEFVAASEAVKEILFVLQVLESMGIKVKTPVTVRVDNMGAIFMTDNSSSSSRTRHIDTRWHFVRELVEGKVVEIIFVKSAENKSDGFTKNISGDLYEAHSSDYVWDKSDVGGCALDASTAGRVLEGYGYGRDVWSHCGSKKPLSAVTGSWILEDGAAVGAGNSSTAHDYTTNEATGEEDP